MGKHLTYLLVSISLGLILMKYMPHGEIAQAISFFSSIIFLFYVFYMPKKIKLYFKSLFPVRWILVAFFIFMLIMIAKIGFTVDVDEKYFINWPLWITGITIMSLIFDFYAGLGINWREYTEKQDYLTEEKLKD